MQKKILVFILSAFLFFPLATYAHQPRLVYNYPPSTKESPIVIEKPDISQAFYGELNKKSDFYKIKLTEDKALYFNILIPDLSHLNFISFGEKSVAKAKVNNAPIVKITNNLNKEEVVFGGDNTFTERFFEEFGGDNYWKGPEIKQNFLKGDYLIEVSSQSTIGKYVLAVGDIEAFSADEAWNAIKSMPDLKKNFFEKSIFSSYWNKIGLFLGGAGLLFFGFVVVIGVIIKKIRNK
jgi:hypothetical protein